MGQGPFLMDKLGLWNVRGLNRPQKQRDVLLFMHNFQVGMFGLLETRIKRTKILKAFLNLCREWSFFTNLDKHPGERIWLLWKPHIYKVDIRRTGEHVIHCAIKHIGTKKEMEVTWVYGFNDNGMRRKLWEDIKEIHKQSKGPWAIMGDFNNVLQSDERIGSKVTYAEIKGFKECMLKCEMQEMKSSESFYTWNNKQEGEDKAMSRIDRVLTNNDCMTTLPDSEVHYQNGGLFDHCPSLVRWEQPRKIQQKIFR
ncbi:uncharacterized protein LOC142169847 [Nicotiana tabacum]|uniref:Uncharacterized protein LOC142169847 n=1 Tax=Nicotiana tabacum TaxID=4097 RepID=A0AC58SSC1_TOBAC